MYGKYLIWIIIFSLSNLASLSFGESIEKEKIVILSFKDIDAGKNVIELFHENLLTELVKLNLYTVVERGQIDRIFGELKLAAGEDFEDNQAVEIGKLAQAKLVILGSIGKLNGKIIINARIIDVETAKINAAERIQLYNESEIYQGAKQLVSLLTKSTDNKSKISKPEYKINSLNIVGISFAGLGGLSLLAGIAVFSSDYAYVYPKSKSYINVSNNTVNQNDYSEYKYWSDIDIAMFSSGIALMCLGGALIGASIPLMIYQPKKTMVFININDNISVGVFIKL
ncbi:MAG: hypothetical protein KA885_13180 [Spirochaetes bacterium]|nr:hypothetical protein [Spirochaetota bacterium]